MFEMEELIYRLLGDGETVAENMRRVIDFHADEYPHGDWSPYRAIPF